MPANGHTYSLSAFFIILFVLFILPVQLLQGQQHEEDPLEAHYARIAEYMDSGAYQEAIVEYGFILAHHEELSDTVGLADAFYNRGKLQRIDGDYDAALSDFIVSLNLSQAAAYKKGIAYAFLNMGIVYSTRQGESSEAGLPYFEDALSISREIGDMKCMSYALNNIALVYLDKEEYEKALSCHFESLEIKKETGDRRGIASSYGNIGDIYTLMDDHHTAIAYNEQALDIYRETNDLYGIIHCILEIGHAYVNLGQTDRAGPYLQEALDHIGEIGSLQMISGIYQYLYIYHEAAGNYKRALEFHEKYTAVEDSIYSDRSGRQIAELQVMYETEKKEAAIAQLTNENIINELCLKKSENLRIFFIIAFSLMLLVAGLAYFAYMQKQKANRFLEERNKFEIENKKRAINLFGQQVSKEVALELLSDSFKSGSKKLFACIMFLDIRDFTPFVADKEPGEIIQYQNDVFGFMIDVITRYHGIINQFMGDGFMATFGAPASSGSDCQHAVDAALEIVSQLNHRTASGKLPPTRVGIGLHAGHIVTGNVGTAERKQYSITGNTVILASRIEQLNKKYHSEILISKEVYEKVDLGGIPAQHIGQVVLKGRSSPVDLIKLTAG